MTRVLRFTDWKRFVEAAVCIHRRGVAPKIRRFSTIQNNGKRLLNVSQRQSTVLHPHRRLKKKTKKKKKKAQQNTEIIYLWPTLPRSDNGSRISLER